MDQRLLECATHEAPLPQLQTIHDAAGQNCGNQGLVLLPIPPSSLPIRPNGWFLRDFSRWYG
jgi:hypothetical protein